MLWVPGQGLGKLALCCTGDGWWGTGGQLPSAGQGTLSPVHWPLVDGLPFTLVEAREGPTAHSLFNLVLVLQNLSNKESIEQDQSH